MNPKTKNTIILILLFISIFVSLLIWWVTLPIFQSFDEPAHFAQIQHIALYNSKDVNNTYSIEEYNLLQYLHFLPNSRYTFSNSVNAKGEQSFKENESSINKQKTFLYNGTVENYPPLYYYITAIIYRIFDKTSIFFEVEAIRFVSILLLLGTVYFAYKCAQLIFKKDKFAQYAVLLLIGFLPMLSQFAVSINPDNLIILLFSAFTYYGVRLCQSKSFDIKANIALIVIIILGFLTKQSSYTLIIFLLFLYIIQIKRFKVNIKKYKQYFFILLILVTTLLYLVGGKLIITYMTETFQGIKWFTPFTYISNYYKNYLPSGYVFQSFWGAFGWGYFKFNQQYYDILSIIITIPIIGIIICLYNYQNYKVILQKKYKNITSILFLILMVLIYSIFLVYLDFISLKNTRDFFIQGHYFFPIITSIIILIVYGIKQLFKHKYILHTIYTTIILLFIIFNITALFHILIKAFYLT